MDFARKHRGPDDVDPGSSRSVVDAIYRTISAREASGIPEADCLILDLDAPRPCYRSVWDVYGLRRRPRRSDS